MVRKTYKSSNSALPDMKIPKTFIPDKNLEQHTNNLLNEEAKKEAPQTQPIGDNTDNILDIGECEYERVFVSKMRKAFLRTRFKPEESDVVIEDLITKVTQYAQSKGRTIETFKKYDAERIREAQMTSKEGIIKVDIGYNDECNPVIHAELKFYSRSSVDIKEYKGLTKIIREMGKDFKFVSSV